MLYEVDYINGNDSNTGAPGNPWQHDPRMPAASANAAAVTLSSGDIIEYVGSPTHWLLGPDNGIALQAGDSGVIRRTRAGDPNPVILDFLEYSTDAWQDQGGNVWRYDVGAGRRGGRCWIDGQALATAASLGEISQSRPWFSGDLQYIYLYSGADPWIAHGTGMAWNNRTSNPQGIVIASDLSTEDLQFLDMHIYGAQLGVDVRGGNTTPTLDNVNVSRWWQHGIRFLGDSEVPIRYATVQNSTVDMDTQIDEFPLTGERGGDGIMLQGANLGGRILRCHVQDQHHSAYMMNAWADGLNQILMGPIACEVGYCTADNRNSFYGRGIGAVGGVPGDNHAGYNIIHHNKWTNMQVRSQVSGDNVHVYNNVFSGTLGSFVRSAAVFAYRWNGQGLMLGTYNDNGFGVQSVRNCKVFNNTFVGNWNEGLRVQTEDGSRGNGNEIFNNIFYDNFTSPDPDPNVAAIDDVEIVIYNSASGEPSPVNVFRDNVIGRRGGSAGDNVVYQRTEPAAHQYFTVAQFNAYQSNTGNSADVAALLMTPEGNPVTGSAVKGAGTLPDLAPANLIAAPNDITGAQWGNSANIVRDRFGFSASAALGQVFAQPADTTYPVTLTFSMLIGGRATTVYVDSDADNATLRLNDGNSVTNGPFFALPRETMEVQAMTRLFDGAASANWGYLQMRNSVSYPDCHVEVSHVRLAAEDEAAHPLAFRYDRLDLLENDQGAQYVGANATIAAPTVPNIIADDFGALYTQAQATARLEAYHLTAGTVTVAQSETVPAGRVISQSVSPGATAAVGDPVAFVVSAGADVTPPGLPQNVAAQAQSMFSVRVTWTDAVDADSAIASYKVRRDGVLIAEVAA